MFYKGLKGTLMKIEEAPETRYKYEIWFDYTRQAMTTISEGAMVAVPNFASTRDEIHYSILEIASLLPVHYALGSDVSGYPGFVIEAAKSAGQDWVSQESEATDETTKIKCIAIPTNIEWVARKGGDEVDRRQFQQEMSIPMVGHDVFRLDSRATEVVANLNIDLKRDATICIGTLVRDEDVPALLKVDELLRLHFGIFGFTGSGKSNLASTLISSALRAHDLRAKVVIFDFLGEYSTLLVDCIHELDGSLILNLGAETVPESVVEYYNNNSKDSSLAARDFTRSSVFPRALDDIRDKYISVASSLLTAKKVRFLRIPPPSAQDLIGECRDAFKSPGLEDSNRINEMLNKWQETSVDASNISSWIQECRGTLPHLKANGQKTIRAIMEILAEHQKRLSIQLPDESLFSVDELKRELNDENRSSLIIVQSHDPDELRAFSLRLVSSMFGNRRMSGRTGPPIAFFFDEADEFIPRQVDKDSTQAKSRAAATTLARRGRKFGLGLGIATQRIAHLDASILAQPHTYFVSKLPRQYDRQAVSEAFGFTEENFRQTFKFRKGDWLLASYDAAGLEAVPIPIHCPDANERIRQFLTEYTGPKDSKEFSLGAP